MCKRPSSCTSSFAGNKSFIDFCDLINYCHFKYVTKTNMGPIIPHLSKELCGILLFDVVSMGTKYKNVFN